MPLAPYDRTWVHPSGSLRPYYRSFEDATLWPGPLSGWTPTRTVTFSTKAGLDSARTGLQDGDYVVYNGTGVLTISSSSDNGYNFGTSSVATKAVFDFGSYYSANHVKFASTSTSSFYGGFFVNPTNVWYLGGEYTSLKTSGILWNGGSGSGVIGAVTHGCGAGGMFICPSSSHLTTQNCWFVWESFGNNQNPSGDPHGDSGGGYHDGLIADDNQSNSTMTGNTFMVYGHDTDTGSCVQFGDATGTNISLSNNVFFVKTENNLYAASVSPWDFACGFVAWGSASLSGNLVELLQVKNYAGRATYCDSLTSTSTNGVTVKHGRAIDTNQNTSILSAHDGTLSSTAPWDTRHTTKFIHQDVI